VKKSKKHKPASLSQTNAENLQTPHENKTLGGESEQTGPKKRCVRMVQKKKRRMSEIDTPNRDARSERAGHTRGTEKSGCRNRQGNYRQKGGDTLNELLKKPAVRKGCVGKGGGGPPVSR